MYFKVILMFLLVSQMLAAPGAGGAGAAGAGAAGAGDAGAGAAGAGDPTTLAAGSGGNGTDESVNTYKCSCNPSKPGCRCVNWQTHDQWKENQRASRG